MTNGKRTTTATRTSRWLAERQTRRHCIVLLDRNFLEEFGVVPGKE